MKDQNYYKILYFISFVILLTLGVQGYWAYKTYTAEKQELLADVQNSLDVSSPSGRKRVPKQRRRLAGTIQRRSCALYPSYTSRASVLPAVVVMRTASSMVAWWHGGMEDARCFDPSRFELRYASR
ncbi:MAG: hypothetical protein ABJM56_14840 [Gilvibacter sp.]